MKEIHIPIDDGIKKIALAHSEERIKFEYNRFRLSLEQRKSMILIGTIGQLIFKKFLEEQNIEFSFEFQAGKYDQMDFTVNNKIIEIKCSGFGEKYNQMNLLYAEDQLGRGILKQFAYCVQLFINGYDRKTKLLDIKKCNDGILSGYIEFNEIKKFKNPEKKYFGDDYKVPLTNLKPIEEFIDEFHDSNNNKRK